MARGKRRGLSVSSAQLAGVKTRIQNTAEKTTRQALVELRAGAEDIAELAREYAPVDEGDLEDAIDVLGEDRGGKNTRTRITIGVDESGGTNKPVEGYYEYMHEGDYKLGKKSKEKAASLGDGSGTNGRVVGKKFLERAIDDLESSVRKDLFDSIRGALR